MQPAETNRPKKRSEHTPEQQALLEEYWNAVARLRMARAAFEQVTDPDLISACVLEIAAAQTRCSYLMGQLKKQQVTGMYVLR